MKTQNVQTQRGRRDGFALIMVLTISALTTLTVLALVALSVNQTRVGRSDRDRARAQASAVLSMKLAIGELQKHAGPDQRISATGDIVHPYKETPDGTETKVEKAQQPYLTGFWDSWNPNPLSGSTPDYDVEKTNRFRKWILSGLSDTEARDKTLPTRANNVANSVTVLGTNSLGLNKTESQLDAEEKKLLVKAGKIQGKLGTVVTGSTAYAVLDEGVKARVNMSPVNASRIKSNAEAMAQVGNPARNAVEKADTDLAALKDKRAELIKAPTYETIALLEPKVLPFSHDLTTTSTGVLADVANGGLRKDLSTMFDVSSFATIPEFTGMKLYKGDTVGLGKQDPPWEFFFNYFRMQTPGGGLGAQAGMLKVLGLDGFDAERSRRASSFNLGMTDFKGGGSYFTANKKEETQPGTPLAPVIASCDIFYSAFAKQCHNNWVNQTRAAFGQPTGAVNYADPAEFNHMLHLVYQPVITLWNPYNVPIQMVYGRIEIETPPVAFQFSRQPTVGPSNINGVDITGVTSTMFMPVNHFYVYDGDRGKIKRFILNLYNDKPTGGVISYIPGSPEEKEARTIKFQPGEVRVFSPYMPPDILWNSNVPVDSDAGGSGSATTSLFDYLNQNIPQLPTAPGWNGFQYGFNIDWLCPNHNAPNGTSYYLTGKNGPVQHNGVIGTRLTDSWVVEARPEAQIDSGGAPFTTYAVSLTDTKGQIFSRLEFFHGGKDDMLRKAMKGPKSDLDSSGKITCGPFLADDYKLGLTQQLSSARFFPLFMLSAQAKTAMDSEFPTKPFIHGNPTRPLVVVDLTKENQAWNSHELSIRKFNSGSFQFDSVNNRGYFVSGREANTGTTLGATRDTPNMPVQGVAQLAHANTAGLSRYLPNADGVVGQSFAHPMIPAGRIQQSNTSLGYDLIDHAYLANWRLWDSWYASTIGNYRGVSFTGTSARGPGAVATDFFKPKTDGSSLPLLNPRFVPYLGATGGADQAITDTAISANSSTTSKDGYKRAAAYQLLSGGFNVNSTSKEAWKALLASLNASSLPVSAPNVAGTTFSFDKAGIPDATTYFAKTRLANALPAPRAPSGEPEWQAMLGGRELDDTQLDKLAAKIVEQVKTRGPFLSLAEFVNRRLSTDEDLARWGALQSAIEKANLGAKTLLPAYGLILTNAEIKDFGYEFPKAAEDSTADGASSSLDQLAVLTQLGSTLSARSDTFKIRFYGDTSDSTNKTASRAYGEAVVQRLPDYVDPTNKAYDSPTTDSNRNFGRRFTVVSFRWLAPDEI